MSTRRSLFAVTALAAISSGGAMAQGPADPAQLGVVMEYYSFDEFVVFRRDRADWKIRSYMYGSNQPAAQPSK
ncbi:MAG: hypothetical protein LCH93_17955 [Proteobacteria bacterium]|nr:hypothetical protein [Pseudomonadota bacterium]